MFVKGEKPNKEQIKIKWNLSTHTQILCLKNVFNLHKKVIFLKSSKQKQRVMTENWLFERFLIIILSNICVNTWNSGEVSHRFLHDFVRLVDTPLNIVCIDGVHRVIQPTFLPAQPIRGRDPQFPERFKLLDNTTDPWILWEEKHWDILVNMTQLLN